MVTTLPTLLIIMPGSKLESIYGRLSWSLLGWEKIRRRALREEAQPIHFFRSCEVQSLSACKILFTNTLHHRENETLCSKIVHSDQLAVDMAANAVPQYSFYTPNMDNNGHDTGMKFAARWLNGFLSPLLVEQSFMEKTLVVVTFDEGIKPDNKIYTLLIGGIYTSRTPLNSLTTIDMVPAAHLDNTSYTHYSLLRTVEDQFSLGNLGRGDATSNSINRANFYPGISSL